MVKVEVRPWETDIGFIQAKGFDVVSFEINEVKCRLSNSSSRGAIRRMFIEHFARLWGVKGLSVSFSDDIGIN